MSAAVRSRRGLALAALATGVVLLGAAGVFAISGRLSLADRRDELAASARTAAAAHLADLPSGHRDDSDLVEQAALPVPDESVLVEYVVSTAVSLGLRSDDVVDGDRADELRAEAERSLGTGAEGSPLQAVSTVIAVEGPASAVAAFLELVERGQYPLSLSSVRLTPQGEDIRAVIGLAGVHFRALSPSQRVALGQAAELTEGGGS